MALSWQPSLLAEEPPSFDPDLTGIERRDLGSGAWCDTLAGWVRGGDAVFATLAAAVLFQPALMGPPRDKQSEPAPT